MAKKTANILARVEPEIKESAERILEEMGIPVSVAINMLYKQIILTRSLPFTPKATTLPLTREEMTTEAFDNMMGIGLSEAKSGQSKPLAEVFTKQRQEIR